MEIKINDASIIVPESHRNITLQAFIRDYVGLKGTKFGCGIGLCGACTIHINGVATRSCLTFVEDVIGQQITTIEGLAATVSPNELHPVQKAWIEESVPQCGYCQAGQIMAAAALLNHNPDPSDHEIRNEMSGNLCRCGTYARIRRAIDRAAKES